MPALARSAIRSRLAEAVTTALGPTGWKESRFPYDLIGQETRSIVHLAFAVGVQQSVPHALDRQRLSVGAVAETMVTVRWIHRMRSSPEIAPVTEYAEALDAGEALMRALLAVDTNPDLSVRLVRIGASSVVGDSHLMQDIECAVLHRLALEA